MFENFKLKRISVVTILANLDCVILIQMEKETRALLRSSFRRQKWKQELSSRLRAVASLEPKA